MSDHATGASWREILPGIHAKSYLPHGRYRSGKELFAQNVHRVVLHAWSFGSCCLFRYTLEANRNASVPKPGAGTSLEREQLRSWQRRIHKLSLLQHQTVCKVLSISVSGRERNDVGCLGFLLLFQSCWALVRRGSG